MNTITVSGKVQKFPGESGWIYLELDEELSKDLRPLIKNIWPALLKADMKLNSTKWLGTIMPIKEGPLFISLPAKIRKQEEIAVGQNITVEVDIQEPS